MTQTSNVSPIADAIGEQASKAVSLTEMPKNRYGFRYIGVHICSRQTWDGEFSSLYLGAAAITKLTDLVTAHKDFPLVNVNVVPVIEKRIHDIPGSWLDKDIYVLGTSFANNGNDEHVISFRVKQNEGGGRSIEIKPRPFLKGLEPNPRVLLFRE